jgi:hypothetical protein
MVTLATIEREVAPRCGPYRRVVASGGTLLGVTVPGLRTNAELGGYEEMYLLRRGVLEDGSDVPGFQADDRERTVRIYSALNGLLEVDRPWAGVPVTDEVIELHHLSPTHELRPAVQAGLWRCFAMERASVTLTDTGAEHDLTELVPWITEPQQVYELEWACASGLSASVWWWRTFMKDGHVWIALPDFPANGLIVMARRPVATKVNGEYSATGPTADGDTLDVPLAYAAAAGHIEAWRHCRPRLQATAQEGMYPSQQEAAAEFTRQAAIHFRPPSRRPMMPEPFGSLGVEKP